MHRKPMYSRETPWWCVTLSVQYLNVSAIKICYKNNVSVLTKIITWSVTLHKVKCWGRSYYRVTGDLKLLLKIINWGGGGGGGEGGGEGVLTNGSS